MKFLREASADKTATHLIICTEKPFIPLGDISKTYEEETGMSLKDKLNQSFPTNN